MAGVEGEGEEKKGAREDGEVSQNSLGPLCGLSYPWNDLPRRLNMSIKLVDL